MFTFCTRCTRVSWVRLESSPRRMCSRSVVSTYCVAIRFTKPATSSTPNTTTPSTIPSPQPEMRMPMISATTAMATPLR